MLPTVRQILMLLSLQIAMTAVCLSECQGGHWPQFRGANAAGRAADDQPLPTDIAPNKHLIWKTSLAKGHSSPVVLGQRVFVTAKRGKKLLTIAIDGTTGDIVWEREAHYDRLESIHRIGPRDAQRRHRRTTRRQHVRLLWVVLLRHRRDRIVAAKHGAVRQSIRSNIVARVGWQ